MREGVLFSDSSDLIFNAVTAVCMVSFISFGLHLKTIKPLPVIPDIKKIEMIKTKFVIKENKKENHVIRKRIEKIPLPSKERAIDLTRKVLLKQDRNDIVPAPTNMQTAQNTGRRVYGLRRVYSVGLGATATSSQSQAVIGKLGNTLNKDVDTIHATKEDIVSRPVSITAVTSMPVLKISVKPEYTEEMKKNGVSGTITAKILVGTDGTVKDIIILNDLGYDSRESAIKAFRQLVFKPAMQGEKSVAVWIIMKFKYVLQE